jgi:hypothetical protein
MEREDPAPCTSGSQVVYSSQKLVEAGQDWEPPPQRAGGVGEPRAMQADPALAGILEASALAHLQGALEGETLATLGALDRQPLLSHLKACGLALAERQKLATAVAKATRRAAETTSAAVAAKPRVEPAAQGFTIYCHRTTLQDGTTLDNSEPAPEFVVAELERRTGKKRPSDAATRSLEQLNLHFMSSP